MKKRISIGVAVLCLAGIATLLLLRRARPVELTPEQAAAEGRSGGYRSLAADSHHPASMPGHLILKGRVVDTQRAPVAGANVLATAPDNDDVLSERVCECGNACGRKLLECGCGEAAGQIAEAVADRRGEVVPLARTTTLPDGSFELDGLSEGSVAVWGQQATAGVAMVASAKVGGEPIELVLRPGEWVHGSARDEASHPLVGIVVTAVFAAHSRFFDAPTDAQGDFRIGPLPPGQYEVVATALGFLPTAEKANTEDGKPMELVLQKPRSIAGRVEGEDGRPVAALDVRLTGEHKKAPVRADAQGRFVFNLLRPGTYSLEVALGDRGAFEDVHVRQTNVEGVVLRLGAAGIMDVLTRDSAGNALAGANVRWSGKPEAESTKTGPDGHARLRTFEKGRGSIDATLEGFLDASGEDVYPGPGATREIQLTLKPAARITGLVTDEEGHPVPTAAIRFDATQEGHEAGENGWGSADGDGGFTQKLAPGNYRLTVTHDDFLDATLQATAPSAPLVVRMASGGLAEGTVVDAEGHSQGGVAVSARQLTQKGADHGRMRQSKTDADGGFALHGLIDGSYLGIAYQQLRSDAGQTVRSTSLHFDVAHGHTNTLLFQFAGLSISGRVVDEHGIGIPGATVWGQRSSGGPSEEPLEEVGGFATVESAADGRFKLESLSSGRYELRAGKKEGFVADSDGAAPAVSAGAEGVVLTLTAQGYLHGRCIDEHGEPVGSFSVNGEDFSSLTGEFKAKVRRSGPTKLRVTAEGYAPLERKADGVLGETREVPDLVLSKGRTVRGHVLDAASGNAVAGANILWSISKTRWTNEATESDPQGDFSIDNVASESVNLRVQHEGYRDARLELSPGQAVVRIPLGVGASVTGHVRDGSGRPVAKAKVSANAPGEQETLDALTGEDGSYTLAHLQPGTYWVNAVASSARFTASFVAQSVSVGESGTVTLDFQPPAETATVSIHLARTGSLYWGAAFLVLGDVPAPASMAEWTAAGGAVVHPSTQSDPWVFAGIPVGRYTLFLMGGSRKGYALDRESISVSQPGPMLVNIEVGPNVTFLGADEP